MFICQIQANNIYIRLTEDFMKRPLIVLCTMIFLFLTLPMRMIYVVNNTEKIPSVSNSTRSIVVSELRGEIFDCNMKPLVNRKSENAIAAMPCRESAEILKDYLDVEEYYSLLTNIEKAEPFTCICEFGEENEFVKVSEKFNRYTDDGFCCHVTGYINPADNEGVYGIEKSYDALLKSEKRQLIFRYNTTAHGRMLAGGECSFAYENYYSQKGVKLTIDADIQRIAENAMKLYEVEKGACVVLDAKNGEIRAMVSFPRFNQNNIAISLNDENSPFMNRSVSAYSVGSVFKYVVAMAAIEAGVENFESYCTGSLKTGGTTFGCSDYVAHGSVTLRKAFAYSCNTYFIRLALKLGSERILKTAENLGFGKSFSLADGMNPDKGRLPSTEEIVTDGALANISFGQGGLLATPLQIASCYSAAVNGGEYISPKLVTSTVNSDGTENKIREKGYRYRAVSPEEAEKMKNLLINNFNEGTCVEAKPQNCIAGGKTSTAQTGWLNEKGEEILHSWFAGFAEAGDNIYTVVVFKENGESGSRDCGPVFKEITQRLAEISVNN